MAISFRAAGTPVFTANNVPASPTLSPVSPASAADGDVLLCYAFCRSQTATASVSTSGWSLVSGAPWSSGTANGGRLYVWTKLHTGSNDDPAVVYTGMTTGTSGSTAVATVVAYQGMSQVLDGTITTSDLAAQGASSTMPAFTTATNGSMVLGFGVKLQDLAGTITVATFTERSEFGSANGGGLYGGMGEKLQATAGSSGTGTMTWSSATSNRAFMVTMGFRATVQVTKTQTATARISKNITKTQTATARVSKQVTKTQSATANIAAAVNESETTVGRVSLTGLRRPASRGAHVIKVRARVKPDASDDFNRSDGAPGSDWGVAVSGYNVPNIVSNRLDWPQFPALVHDLVLPADQYVQCEVVSPAKEVEFLLRWTNPNTGNESGYSIRASCGGLFPAEAFEWSGGFGASLGFANGIMTSADTWMRAEIRGSRLAIYGSPDGVTWTLRQTWTDSTITAGGQVGLYHPNNVVYTGGDVDNFSAGALKSTSFIRAALYEGGTHHEDLFNRSNQDPLAGEWNLLAGSTGTAKLSSNKVVVTSPGSDGDKLYSYGPATRNRLTARQWSECTISQTDTDGGPAVRIGGATGMSAYFFTSLLGSICKFHNGSFSEIGADVNAYLHDGCTVRLEVEQDTNTVLRLYVDGVLRDTTTDTSGTQVTGAGSGPGFFLYSSQDASDGVDNWRGGTLGTLRSGTSWLETEKLGTEWAEYALTVPQTEADDIVDYGSLEVRFQGVDGVNKPVVFEVDRVALEVPPPDKTAGGFSYFPWHDHFYGASLDGAYWSSSETPEGDGTIILQNDASTVLAGPSALHMYGRTWTMQIAASPLSTGNLASTYLSMFIDGSHYVGFVWGASGGTPNLSATRNYGSGFTNLGTVSIGTTYKWSRIREFGGVTHWEYSADGRDWLLLYSEPTPIDMSAVSIEIGSSNNGDTTTQDFRLDMAAYGDLLQPTFTQTATANITGGGSQITKTQTATARISAQATKTQPANARVSKNVTRTQTATARISTQRTYSQNATARVSKQATRTQTATARVSKQTTRTQTATARVSKNFTFAQTATARVSAQVTKTQPANARVSKQITRTQTATARISKQFTFTQPANARVSAQATKTQSATANIVTGVQTTKTQAATARVQKQGTFAQSATARLQKQITFAQTAVARISKNFTKDQTATARVSAQVQKTQPANAAVRNQNTRTQAATARISKQRTFTQSAVARVQKQFTLAQTAAARISKNFTRTQPATARISKNVTRTQPANARISKNVTRAQTATARISKNATRTQSAIARISKNFTRTQPASARVSAQVTKTQPANAAILGQRTFTQSATAKITNNKTFTQSARAAIVQQATRTQTAVSRISKNRTLAQAATARISKQITRAQTAVARISKNFTRTQPANARISKNFTRTQTATARITRNVTRTQTATATIVVGGQTTKTQSATARITRSVTRTQTATARVSKNATKTQTATARVSAQAQTSLPAVARVQLSRTLTQPGTATIVVAAARTFTQSATAEIVLPAGKIPRDYRDGWLDDGVEHLQRTGVADPGQAPPEGDNPPFELEGWLEDGPVYEEEGLAEDNEPPDTAPGGWLDTSG